MTSGQRKTGRKHTPIVSEAQRRLFGAVAGGSVSLPGLSKTKAKEHLVEVKGAKLPARTAPKSKGPVKGLVRKRKRKSK